MRGPVLAQFPPLLLLLVELMVVLLLLLLVVLMVGMVRGHVVESIGAHCYMAENSSIVLLCAARSNVNCLDS
jgi:hypothetical protein